MKKIKEILQKSPVPSTMLAAYNAVELTDEERESALLEARRDKYWKLKDAAQHQQQLNKLQEFARPWTYDEMFNVAVKRANELVRITDHKAYVFDQHSTPVFKLLCQYFTGDKAFETEGRSLKKGIMLLGNVGVGKTDLLRAFEFNKVRCFQTITCSEISAMVQERGAEFWTTYTGYIPGHGGRQIFLTAQYWMAL